MINLEDFKEIKNIKPKKQRYYRLSATTNGIRLNREASEYLFGSNKKIKLCFLLNKEKKELVVMPDNRKNAWEVERKDKVHSIMINSKMLAEPIFNEMEKQVDGYGNDRYTKACYGKIDHTENGVPVVIFNLLQKKPLISEEQGGAKNAEKQDGAVS